MEGHGQIGGGQDQGDGVLDEVVAERCRRQHGRPPERDRLYEVYAAYIASSGAAVRAAGGIT